MLLIKFPLQAAEANRKPEQASRFYAKGALQYVTPLLTEALKRQVSKMGKLLLVDARYILWQLSHQQCDVKTCKLF